MNPLGPPVSKQPVVIVKKEAPLEPLLPLPDSYKHDFIQKICEESAMVAETIDNFEGSRAKKKKLIAWRNKAVKLID